jgi:hypothetical protein
MWGLGKKRIAVAADNQDAANITSYAKSESVKQLIRECSRCSHATINCLGDNNLTGTL